VNTVPVDPPPAPRPPLGPAPLPPKIDAAGELPDPPAPLEPDEPLAVPSTDPEPVLLRPVLEPDESVLPTVLTTPPTAPVAPPPPPPLPLPPTATLVVPLLTVTLDFEPVTEPPLGRGFEPVEPVDTGGVVTLVVVDGTVTKGVVATGVVTAGTVADGVVTVVVVPGTLSAIAVAAPAAESAMAKMTVAAIRLPCAMRQRATSPADR